MLCKPVQMRQEENGWRMSVAEPFILKHLHLDGTHTEYVKKANYDELLGQAEKMADALREGSCACKSGQEHCSEPGCGYFTQKALTDWLKFREGK